MRGLMPSSAFWSSPKRFGLSKNWCRIRIVHLLPIILIVFVTPQVLWSPFGHGSVAFIVAVLYYAF